MKPTSKRRFVSVGTKLAVATFLVLAVVTAAVDAGLSSFLRDEMIAAKEQGARMASALFLRSAATPVVFDDATGMHDAVALLGQDPEVLGVELQGATPDGKLGNPLASQVRPGEPRAPGRWVDATAVERRPDRIIVRDAIRDPDHRVIAVAAIQYSLARENAAFQELHRRIPLYAAGVVLLLTFLLQLVTRRTISRPLGRLLHTVKQVEAGERAQLDAGAAHDEVGRLADAFGRMAEAVDRRERDIARRNQDMKLVLDNVGQGFLVVDAAGVMAPERSAIVTRWFGPAEPGQTVAAYLQAVDPIAACMLELGLDSIRAAVLPLELCVDQLPKWLDHGARRFMCEYHPIVGGETLHQLVLVLSDVTSEVERARAETAQRDLMAGVSRLLADRSSFFDFLEEAHGLVERVVDASPDASIEQVMRDTHTLKGICALFGMNGIAGTCHTLESRMLETRALPSESERDDLFRQWRALRSGLQTFAGAERSGIALSHDEYRGFQQALAADVPHHDLLRLVERWVDDPVLPRLDRLAEHATKLAGRLGKCKVTVDFGATSLRLPHEPWNRLWPCLGHVVRNAVDHGLETESERLSAGKPAAAQLTLTADETDGAVVIVIADDGRGIDWDALRRKAASLALPSATQEDLVAAMFADGVTTRDSATVSSGRGVGLAAVRQIVESLGGEIRVESERGRGTRFGFSFSTARSRDSLRRAS